MIMHDFLLNSMAMNLQNSIYNPYGQLQTKFFIRTHIILMKYKAKSFILLLNYNEEKLFYATTFVT